MLATFTDKRFSRRSWLFEPKFDGERCLVFARHGKPILFSRNKKNLNEKYPELIPALKEQSLDSYILDGEIVTFEDSVTSFAKLQKRMQVRHPSPSLQREVPVKLCAFDLLYLEGFDLRGLPLLYRKRLLRRSFKFKNRLKFTRHRKTYGKKYYREACNAGMEGLIAKDETSTYVSRRSPGWLKFKCVKEQEFVIGGYTDPKGHRVGLGALLVGYFKGKKFRFAGKVGTGYDTAMLHSLKRHLSKLGTESRPFEHTPSQNGGVHWTKPRLVAQIGFTEWTVNGKLRHPRFIGLRDDKKAKEVVREE